jgi:hypothetical protein
MAAFRVDGDAIVQALVLICHIKIPARINPDPIRNRDALADRINDAFGGVVSKKDVDAGRQGPITVI